MTSVSTIDTIEAFLGRSSTISLRQLLFASSKQPLSVRNRLLEISSINREQAKQCWEAAKDYVIAFHNAFVILPEPERQVIRDRYLSESGFISEENNSVMPLALPDHAISIDFPPLPRIPIPGRININIGDIADAIKDKLEGVLGNVAQTIKEIVLGIPEELFFIIEGFVSRIIQFGELLKDGEIAKALGILLQSVALLIRDVAGSIVTLVANAINDVVSGIVGGLIFARMLTQDEKDFAHAIFYGQINLTFVQIANIGLKNEGMVAGSVIYMHGGIDLEDVGSRALFAHELTHVWQNQIMMGNGTRTATKEHLSHLFRGAPDPYELPGIDNSTSWADLGAEQRAKLVGTWQKHIDRTSSRFPGPSPLATRSVRTNYRRILTGIGLF